MEKGQIGRKRSGKGIYVCMYTYDEESFYFFQLFFLLRWRSKIKSRTCNELILIRTEDSRELYLNRKHRYVLTMCSHFVFGIGLKVTAGTPRFIPERKKRQLSWFWWNVLFAGPADWNKYCCSRMNSGTLVFEEDFRAARITPEIKITSRQVMN